jgi:hypothetical protein
MKKTIACIVLLFTIATTYGQKMKVIEMRQGPDTLWISELYLMSLVQSASVRLQIDTTLQGGIVKTFKLSFKDTSKFKDMYISSNEVFPQKSAQYKIKHIELDAVSRPWNIKPKHLKRMKFLTIKLNDFMVRY